MSVGASLSRVAALALNGHRQAVRDKVLYVLAGFGIVLIGASILVAQLTVGEKPRIVMDLGLSVSALLTTLTAIFVSINQLAREIERRTIDTILSKPVSRWEFIFGRFLGMALTLGLMVVVMGALHAAVLAAVDGLDSAMLAALWLTWIEALFVAALALFVGSFATPVPSMFISLAVVVIGHSSWGLVMMSQRVAEPLLVWILRALYVVLPNLELLNVRSEVVWDVAIPFEVVVHGTVYGALYSGALLLLAAGALGRRDIR